MAISNLTTTFSAGLKWTAQNTITGGNYTPITNSGSLTKSVANGTSAANTVAGGSDEIVSFNQTINAGSSATFDLTSLTNILAQTGISLARVKGIMIRLLSAADDSTISPAPTSTSTVTVTNNGPTLPNALDFQAGGSGLTLALTAGAGAITAVAIGVAGSGYPKSSSFIVAPNQASGSGGVISVTTNASGVPTAVAVVAGGSGYSGATVPSTVLGQTQINTGGVHLYTDPLAAGFLTVDSTHKNFKIANNDGSNAVTVQISLVGGTT